jgi:hypothetical protein
MTVILDGTGRRPGRRWGSLDQWYSRGAANEKIKQEDQQVGFEAYRWVAVLRHVHPEMTGAGIEGAISGQEVTCFLQPSC